MGRAAASPPPCLALPSGARLVRGRDGVLRVRGAGGDVTLSRMPPATASALRLLEGRGTPEDQVLRRGDEGGLEASAHLHLVLGQLARQGLLRYVIHGRSGEFASLEPLSSEFELAPRPPPPERALCLSRFAYLRRDGQALVLESSRVYVRVVLVPAALALLASLASPATARRARSNGTSGRALIALLARAGLLVEADAEGATHEEHHPALRLWEFHDLLFHTRTRRILRNQPLGGTYRLAGLVPSPPAIRPPQGPVIPLPRPELSRLMREDPSFTSVLEHRRSGRRYGGKPLTVSQLGELLFRSARVRELHSRRGEELSLRPAPSAGARHPLEIYAAVRTCEGLAPGLYRYEPRTHGLEHRSGLTREVRALLSDARPDRDPIQVLLILAARFQRVAYKYEGIAYACILKDAGALLQTLSLAATAMGLASCIVGWGNPSTFEHAALTEGLEESSVAELAIGSAPKGHSHPQRRRG